MVKRVSDKRGAPQGGEFIKYQLIVVHHTSVAALLLGFDVDCCCVAYDGRRLLGLPRGVRAHVEH
eukprot:1100195-Rhodomonas_salina.1